MSDCILTKYVLYSLVNLLKKTQIYNFCFVLLFCFLVFIMVLACISYITSRSRTFVSYEFR